MVVAKSDVCPQVITQNERERTKHFRLFYKLFLSASALVCTVVCKQSVFPSSVCCFQIDVHRAASQLFDVYSCFKAIICCSARKAWRAMT